MITWSRPSSKLFLFHDTPSIGLQIMKLIIWKNNGAVSIGNEQSIFRIGTDCNLWLVIFYFIILFTVNIFKLVVVLIGTYWVSLDLYLNLIFNRSLSRCFPIFSMSHINFFFRDRIRGIPWDSSKSHRRSQCHMSKYAWLMQHEISEWLKIRTV